METVTLDLATYHRFQEMEKNQKIVLAQTGYYNGHTFNGYVEQFETYQYLGKDEAIDKVVKMNGKLMNQVNELTKEIADLKNPPPAPVTPEQVLFEKLQKASRKQRKEFLRTGKLEL